MSDADDDTVPTGRAGVDPLIAYGLESTGSTGDIERPGDGTPWWFIPAMFVIALGFIALWVIISESRSNDDTVASDVTVAAASDQPGDGADAGGSTSSPSPSEVEPTVAPTTIDPLVAALPPPGVARVGPDDYDIAARCEVHLPYEPVDTDTSISSYFFLDGTGDRGLVERIVEGGDDTVIRSLDGIVTSSSDVSPIGDAGAFSATFVGGEVVVNPAEGGDDACSDRVVTNAPGQFAEPHNQVILDVCVDERGLPQGTTISGLTSEGSRFEIQQAGGELAEIVFERGPDDRLRTSAPATILRTDEQLSASGVVSNGVDDLDIAIDVAAGNIENARACTGSDRL